MTRLFNYGIPPSFRRQQFRWLVALTLCWAGPPILTHGGVDAFAVPPRRLSPRKSSSSTSTTRLFGAGSFFSKLFRKADSHNNAEAIQQALTSRRTVNQFETTAVPDQVVNRAIEAAIAAPCHKMTEPWRFILLGDQTIREIATLNAAEIAKKDPAKGAKKQARWERIPGWCVVTSAKSSNSPLQEQEDYAATCCAIQNFMLSLAADRVGTKWTTGPVTRTAEFANVCGIDPSKEQVVGCIWYGYAAGDDGLESIPAPKRKKSLEDVITRRP